MTKISSALTPEEWASEGRDVLPGYVDLKHGIIDLHFGDVDGARDSPRERYALAALLLRDHPQGFTWDDFYALWNAANGADGVFTSSEALRSVAEKIRALLPPREG